MFCRWLRCTVADDEWTMSNEDKRNLTVFACVATVCATAILVVIIANEAWPESRWVAVSALAAFLQAVFVALGVWYAALQLRGVRDESILRRRTELIDGLVRDAQELMLAMFELNKLVADGVQFSPEPADHERLRLAYLNLLGRTTSVEARSTALGDDASPERARLAAAMGPAAAIAHRLPSALDRHDHQQVMLELYEAAKGAFAEAVEKLRSVSLPPPAHLRSPQ